jgi:hypothetical protein
MNILENTQAKVFAFTFLIALAGIFLIDPDKQCHNIFKKPETPPVAVLPSQEPLAPTKFDISNPVPNHQSYTEIVAQVKQWNTEAPGITEVGTYGTSSKGLPLYYLRVRNPGIRGLMPKVLLTSCIHGNEPHATSTMMGFIGTVLSKYGRDEVITNLVDSRDIFFVPVVCPDSYPNSRTSDGVDPNRDFPTPQNPNKQSVASVAAIRSLFVQHKFKAVISGHTLGRVLLHPFGDTRSPSPNDDDFKRLVGKMASLCGYRVEAAHQLYGRPIYGTEVDWYYRNGAFPIVMEFGDHQRPATPSEIRQELDRTFNGILYFITEAPMVDIKSAKESPQVIRRPRLLPRTGYEGSTCTDGSCGQPVIIQEGFYMGDGCNSCGNGQAFGGGCGRWSGWSGGCSSCR